jgi:hypothetical protein
MVRSLLAFLLITLASAPAHALDTLSPADSYMVIDGVESMIHKLLQFNRPPKVCSPAQNTIHSASGKIKLKCPLTTESVCKASEKQCLKHGSKVCRDPSLFAKMKNDPKHLQERLSQVKRTFQQLKPLLRDRCCSIVEDSLEGKALSWNCKNTFNKINFRYAESDSNPPERIDYDANSFTIRTTQAYAVNSTVSQSYLEQIFIHEFGHACASIQLEGIKLPGGRTISGRPALYQNCGAGSLNRSVDPKQWSLPPATTQCILEALAKEEKTYNAHATINACGTQWLNEAYADALLRPGTINNIEGFNDMCRARSDVEHGKARAYLHCFLTDSQITKNFCAQ